MVIIAVGVADRKFRMKLHKIDHFAIDMHLKNHVAASEHKMRVLPDLIRHPLLQMELPVLILRHTDEVLQIHRRTILCRPPIHEGDKLKIHEHPEIILLEPALYD